MGRELGQCQDNDPVNFTHPTGTRFLVSFNASTRSYRAYPKLGEILPENLITATPQAINLLHMNIRTYLEMQPKKGIIVIN
jgi:hypothetical protein